MLLLLGGREVPANIPAIQSHQNNRVQLFSFSPQSLYFNKLFGLYCFFFVFLLFTVVFNQMLYDVSQNTSMPQRVASLMRFREKRKERNFDKKVRYTVRKEVALRYDVLCV